MLFCYSFFIDCSILVCFYFIHIVHEYTVCKLLVLTHSIVPFMHIMITVFRTNTSYKRWDEARKNWGMNINHTRDLVRLGTAYYDRAAVSPERAEEDLRRLALNTWAFVRCMKRHLSPVWEDEEDFQKELKEKLPLEQAEKIIAAAHRPNRALQDLSTSIENLPMHFMRRDEIHAAATIFEDNLGSSERLLTSPIPVFYSRHTARFLSFWLLLLPLGLWGPLGDSWNHINLIPTMSLLSIFLFGIEELATQLEEPFTILPMQGFCDKIYNWCMEIVSFKPGDNGMPVYYYDNYNIDALNGGGVKMNNYSKNLDYSYSSFQSTERNMPTDTPLTQTESQTYTQTQTQTQSFYLQ
jgi:predicted membrane chloride channel (bestrophin family)